MKKWQKVLIIAVALIALFLLAVRLYFRIPVRDYYKASEKAFVIPEYNYGYVAQGLAYDEESGYFLLTGYKNNHMASPVYIVDGVVDKDNRLPDRIVHLKAESGADFLGHAGGLSIHGDYIYIAGGEDHGLYVYDRNEIMSNAGEIGNGGIASCIGFFPTGVSDDDYIGVAFTTIHDNRLYVGEFYREENYPTLPSHKLTTPAGDYNQALVVSYEFSDAADSLFGLNPVPVEAYSITGLVQGMCFDDEGRVYLSTSYATAFSHIYVYEEKGAYTGDTIDVLGVNVPLYTLDTASLIKDVKTAPMSEEIEIVDGKLYTNCEAASNKYIFGKFTGARWCYATDIAFFK